MPALFRACPAVKVWEFQDHYVLVKHTGVHTCHPVPPFSQRDEQVKENVEKRLDLPPKRIHDRHQKNITSEKNSKSINPSLWS